VAGICPERNTAPRHVNGSPHNCATSILPTTEQEPG
jgi:hypothetical protein